MQGVAQSLWYLLFFLGQLPPGTEEPVCVCPGAAELAVSWGRNTHEKKKKKRWRNVPHHPSFIEKKKKRFNFDMTLKCWVLQV